MERRALLEVKHLNSFYEEGNGILSAGKRRKQVLQDVSFSLYQGEVLGLVGESGSGKTTLSRAIVGLLRDYTGELLLHTATPPQMVFQDPYSSLNPAHTIGWILEEPLRVKGGMSKAGRKAQVGEMLDKIGLGPEYAHRKPHELSGGQRQRVAIAAAVIAGPELLVADEPVSALDVTIQAQILELLLSLRQELQLSYLFISHDLNEMMEQCSTLTVLRDGVIIDNMEKKDFPKGTKPREIFVYTCERIAEPLIPLGYKYRKSKNDIYKKDGIFVFSFYFSPSIRFGSTTFTAFFDVSSPVIAQWRSEQEGTEETYDGIVGTSIARLTHRYDDFPRYEVSTLLERERSIQEISGQIQDYALPFFARFSNLPKLLDDVEQEGFFPHRKGFDVPKRNREFIECFREYLQKQ